MSGGDFFDSFFNSGVPEEDWHEAAIEVDYLWNMFMDTLTPLGQARILVKLQDAMSDLRTYLPGYDYETGTLPWERDNEPRKNKLITN